MLRFTAMERHYLRRSTLAGLLGCGLILIYGCGPVPGEPSAGVAVRPTVDPNRPTPTPVALPSPTSSANPRLRARGIIRAITDDSLTFLDIDGNELQLRRSPELTFSWDELTQAQQRRARITVVYLQTPEGLMLIDVFPT